MLKSMRENVKSLKWVLWVVIATFIVAIFFIWGGGGELGSRSRAKTLVQVGKERISAEDYWSALRNRIEAYKAQYSEINRQFIEQLNIPQQVLEQLVEQSLLMEEARSLRLRAGDDEVRERVMAIPGLQQDGKFVGYETYKRALQYNHIRIGEFENSLRKEIILGKMLKLLTAGLAASPEEVWDSYKKNTDSAKIELMILETSKVTLDKIPETAEVQAYFESHKDQYRIPEKREGSAVFLKTEDLKKEIELSDKEIEAYYRDNQAQFTNPETTKASRIWLPFADRDKALVEAEAASVLERLGKGEDFASLAKTFSKDAKAAEGGDYGFFDWRSLPQPELDEINKLTAGQISGLITETDGIAVVRVTEKAAASTTPLDQASLQIRTILLDQKARELAGQRIAKIEKDARSAKSLETALTRAGLKAESTGLLKNGEAWGENDPSGSVSTALFGLEEKEISAPLYTYVGVGLAELRKVEAPRPAEFEEVRTEVEAALAEQRKKEKALGLLNEVKARLTDKNWEDQAAKNKLEVKMVESHKREQYIAVVGESKDADNLAFTLPLKQVSEPFAFDTGYALLRVLERTEADREEFEKVKETETTQVLEQKKNKFLQAYLAGRKEEKGIKIDYDQFLQLTQDILSRYETVEKQ
ncbi:MAG: SurA N-terminal domain-containing protein [Candidatus Aminicenantes bacterium]|nr:SurA N-terminal domain-containing protein [Candidatus Aminicenantes bacterium]